MRDLYTLDAFIETLESLVRYARDGKLVSCKVQLEPTGLSSHCYKLLDGTAVPGMGELDDKSLPTAPGKGQGGPGRDPQC